MGFFATFWKWNSSAQKRNFEKSLLEIAVLHWAWGVSEKTYQPTLHMTESQRYCCKRSRVGQKRPFWPSYSWGSVIPSVGWYCFVTTDQFQCRTAISSGDFSKFLHWAELHGYPYGAVASRTSKRGERLRKKGGQYLLPTKNTYYTWMKNLMEISFLLSDMI